MRVIAARAKGTHRGAASVAVTSVVNGPGLAFLLHPKRRTAEINVAVFVNGIEGSHERLMVKLQYYFRQPRDPRGRFQVPNIGLYRADRAITQGLPLALVGARQGG